MKKLICNGILIAYYEIDTKYEDTLFLNTRPILDRNGLKDCCEIDGLVASIVSLVEDRQFEKLSFLNIVKQK